MSKQSLLVPEAIERRILVLRKQNVILDFHLAEMYGVETKLLKRAVRRNIDGSSSDFIFQLSNEEAEFLVSQNVIPHRKYFGGSLPYAFTKQGVAMLSSVLNTKRACHSSKY